MKTALTFTESRSEHGKRKVTCYDGKLKVAEIQEERRYGRDEIYAYGYTNDSKHPGGEYIGRAPNFATARYNALDWYEKNRDKIKTKKAEAKYLPAFDAQFYPTPSKLAGEMIATVDWTGTENILEPSAGKGNLADAVVSMFDSYHGTLWKGRYHNHINADEVRERIDCIEQDENLRSILTGKGYRVVGDDFLTFQTFKKYDLIIMNPPFANGHEHLLKALEMQKHGGQICCLLNAETIRNPSIFSKRMLVNKLDELGAKIKFVQGGFAHSERKTDVEVAIVTVNIPVQAEESDIWNHLEQAQAQEVSENGGCNALVSGDWMEQMIAHYQLEAKVGIKLLQEYAGIKPLQIVRANEYAEPLLGVKISGKGYATLKDSVNAYIRELRGEYWKQLFMRKELTSMMTSEMQNQYRYKVNALCDYEFSAFNIKQIMIDLGKHLQGGIEESIMSLFEEFSEKHSWYPECAKNVHYYNGWRTNEAHKVGMRVIIPVNGCWAEQRDGAKLDVYHVYNVIADLERAMSYLDTGDKFLHRNTDYEIKLANSEGKTKVEFTYFTAQFYKKGTAHIKFLPEARILVDRMNIFASRKKNWLPPYYGKKHYKDMTEEEQAVIDSFHGNDEPGSGMFEYEEVVSSPDNYMVEAGNVLALAQ